MSPSHFVGVKQCSDAVVVEIGKSGSSNYRDPALHCRGVVDDFCLPLLGQANQASVASSLCKRRPQAADLEANRTLNVQAQAVGAMWLMS